MKLRIMFFLVGITLTNPHLTAQRYTKADSVKADDYFKQSFRYRLYSEQHQLYLDSALQVIPTHAYYWQQKSMPLYKQDKWELAKPFLDSAVKYGPEHYLEYRGFMRCIFERNYQTAKEDFHEATRRYGNRYVMDHSYEFYLGLCCLQLNQIDSAEYYIHRVIQEDQHRFGEYGVHFNHWFYRAMVAFEKGDLQGCIQYLEHTLKRYPQCADAHYYKALCLNQLNKNTEAKEEAKLAKQFADQHYSLNEDNAIYEWYPYQVKTYYYETLVNNL